MMGDDDGDYDVNGDDKDEVDFDAMILIINEDGDDYDVYC